MQTTQTPTEAPAFVHPLIARARAELAKAEATVANMEAALERGDSLSSFALCGLLACELWALKDRLGIRDLNGKEVWGNARARAIYADFQAEQAALQARVAAHNAAAGAGR